MIFLRVFVNFWIFIVFLTGSVSGQEADRKSPAQLRQFLEAAIDQVGKTLLYDPGYTKLSFPNGDIPENKGVCSDVIVRSFRKIGLDLQKEVHHDIKKNFAQYPKKWGLKKPDSNIDHRRVLNLMCYFERRGYAVKESREAGDFLPGDIVAWNLSYKPTAGSFVQKPKNQGMNHINDGLPHIGVVTDKRGNSGNFLLVHNIGAGAQLEDVLFDWEIIGHYRYFQISK